MNLDKVFDFLRDVWTKHSPAMFVLLVVLLAVNLYVLPAGQAIPVGTMWDTVKTAVDGSVTEMGIKVERGYVIVVCVYLVFVAVSWLGGILAGLPILRILTTERIPSIEIAECAGRLLGSGADLYETEKRLGALVEKYRRSFLERKERSPHEWLNERASLWRRYYGHSLLATAALLAWWHSLTPGSWGSRILVLASISAVCAALFRWRVRLLWGRNSTWEMWAALEAYKRERPVSKEPEGVAVERGRALGAAMQYEKARSRHPSRIIMNLAWLFGQRAGRSASARVNHVPHWEAPEWRVSASLAMRVDDEEVVPYGALDAEPYRARFRSLLECEGSGLFLLVTPSAGLAPAANMSGSNYCIAQRSHAGSILCLQYHLESGDALGSIRVRTHHRGSAFVQDLDEHPIEQLAQGVIRGLDEEMHSAVLTGGVGNSWRAQESDSWTTIFPGHTYLAVASISSTVHVVFGFQCYAIDGRPSSVLIAYKIMHVVGDPLPPPDVAPWWRPAAWMGLWKAQ